MVCELRKKIFTKTTTQGPWSGGQGSNTSTKGTRVGKQSSINGKSWIKQFLSQSCTATDCIVMA